jgi:hypothetical protein
MAGPHDALCKHAFTDLEHARGLLRGMVPPAIEKLVDWDTLARDMTTLVGRALDERTADVLYQVRLGGRDAFIYVLLEHQSTGCPEMHLRLLDAMVRIWWRHGTASGATKPLPAILPVVLHHSDSGWSTPTDLAALLDLDADALEVLRPHLPLFQFVLDDISKATDEALRARETATPFGRMMLVALRYGRTDEGLFAAAARWKDIVAQILAQPGGEYAFNLFVSYAQLVGKRPPAAVLHDLKTALRGAVEEDVVATTWDQLTEEVGAREARNLLLSQVEERFGPMDDTARARIEAADLATLRRWARRFARAATLAEVFEG